MDNGLPTIIKTGSENPMAAGMNGLGVGSGFIGGLIIGSMWGGNGWGGWGNNRGAGQAAADATLINGVQNVANQVQNAALNQMQGTNALGLQIANSNANTVAAVNANTVAGLQGQAALQQQICCATNNLGQQIDSTGDLTTAAINAANIQSMQNTQAVMAGLANVGNAVVNQGYQGQLTAKDQALLLTQQHNQIMAAIADSTYKNEQQHCQDRELMRENATQLLRSELSEKNSKIASLEAQITAYNQNLYLISQLKPAATTTAGA